jgi:hypothetical protein
MMALSLKSYDLLRIFFVFIYFLFVLVLSNRSCPKINFLIMFLCNNISNIFPNNVPNKIEKIRLN